MGVSIPLSITCGRSRQEAVAAALEWARACLAYAAGCRVHGVNGRAANAVWLSEAGRFRRIAATLRANPTP